MIWLTRRDSTRNESCASCIWWSNECNSWEVSLVFSCLFLSLNECESCRCWFEVGDLFSSSRTLYRWKERNWTDICFFPNWNDFARWEGWYSSNEQHGQQREKVVASTRHSAMGSDVLSSSPSAMTQSDDTNCFIFSWKKTNSRSNAMTPHLISSLCVEFNERTFDLVVMYLSRPVDQRVSRTVGRSSKLFAWFVPHCLRHHNRSTVGQSFLFPLSIDWKSRWFIIVNV